MQRAFRLLVFGVVFVKGFCVLMGGVKKGLVQAVDLVSLVGGIQSRLVAYQLMG